MTNPSAVARRPPSPRRSATPDTGTLVLTSVYPPAPLPVGRYVGPQDVELPARAGRRAAPRGPRRAARPGSGHDPRDPVRLGGAGAVRSGRGRAGRPRRRRLEPPQRRSAGCCRGRPRSGCSTTRRARSPWRRADTAAVTSAGSASPTTARPRPTPRCARLSRSRSSAPLPVDASSPSRVREASRRHSPGIRPEWLLLSRGARDGDRGPRLRRGRPALRRLTRLRPVRRALLGNVSGALVRAAGCPVVVTPRIAIARRAPAAAARRRVMRVFPSASAVAVPRRTSRSAELRLGYVVPTDWAERPGRRGGSIACGERWTATMVVHSRRAALDRLGPSRTGGLGRWHRDAETFATALELDLLDAGDFVR